MDTCLEDAYLPLPLSLALLFFASLDATIVAELEANQSLIDYLLEHLLFSTRRSSDRLVSTSLLQSILYELVVRFRVSLFLRSFFDFGLIAGLNVLLELGKLLPRRLIVQQDLLAIQVTPELVTVDLFCVDSR